MPGGCGRRDKAASCCDGTVCGDDCCAKGYECKTSGSGRYMTKQCVLKCALTTSRSYITFKLLLHLHFLGLDPLYILSSLTGFASAEEIYFRC